MILSKQLNTSKLVRPDDFASTNTIKLLDNGLVAYIPYRGLPIFTGIGQRVLDALEGELLTEAERIGFSQYRIPALMSNEDLRQGQEIGEQFRSKLIQLNEPLNDFHLLSTPEMLILRMSQYANLSHNSLPVNLSYSTDFFRNMRTQSFLTCRQFRIFGTLSILEDEKSLIKCRQDVENSVVKVFDRLGVKWINQALEHEKHAFELFYEYQERSRNHIADKQVMSVAMGYHYGSRFNVPVKYRDSRNKMQRPKIFTFGLAVNRLLNACFEACRDDFGFALAKSIRPFDVVVIANSKRDRALGQEAYGHFYDRRVRVALDDRYKMPVEDRLAFSRFIGSPVAILVNRGQYRMFERNSGNGSEIVSYSSIDEKFFRI